MPDVVSAPPPSLIPLIIGSSSSLDDCQHGQVRSDYTDGGKCHQQYTNWPGVHWPAASMVRNVHRQTSGDPFQVIMLLTVCLTKEVSVLLTSAASCVF